MCCAPCPFSGTDLSVTELGKAAKGTEAVDPGANHGMNVFTHTFIQGLPDPLSTEEMKFKVPKIVKC